MEQGQIITSTGTTDSTKEFNVTLDRLSTWWESKEQSKNHDIDYDADGGICSPTLSESDLKANLNTTYSTRKVGDVSYNGDVEYYFGYGGDDGSFASDSSSNAESIYDEEDEQQMRFREIMCSLGYYRPIKELIAAAAEEFPDNVLIAINKEFFKDYIKTHQLTIENMPQVMHLLVAMEDICNLSKYTSFTIKATHLAKNAMRIYNVALRKSLGNVESVITPFVDEVVIVPNQSAVAAPVVEGLIETLLPHVYEEIDDVNFRRYVGTVREVSPHCVQFYFDMHDGPDDCHIRKSVDIIIRPGRVPIRCQHRALHLLSEDPHMRAYLFPNENPNPKAPVCATLNLINRSIEANKEQRQAVRHIAEGPTEFAPYVIFGPPGTGKTTTIVEAILQLRLQKPRSRILVTAGSNSACDTIALRICEYFNSSPQLKQHIAHQQRQSHIFTMDVAANRQIIRYYSRTAYRKCAGTMGPTLRKHSNCSKGEADRMSVKQLRQYGIIVATLCTVGILVTSDLGQFNFFTHVFIDEAGASTEPETLVGLMGIKTNAQCHVILCGDHKQLGPVLKSKRAEALGLGRSMMERLLARKCYALDKNGNYDRTLQTRLRRNYRSHAEIVRMYNHLYYNNELIAEAPCANVNIAANWYLLPNGKFPIIFQAVHGDMQQGENSKSSFNSLEVEQVLWYVRCLLGNGIAGKVVKQTDIGIISPYRAQCEKIQTELESHSIHQIDVGSVERFQGREKQIIIVSFVRSFTGLGFVRNPRRLNVILSRAKSLLLLIGNPLTLGRNADFRFLINECKLQNTYLHKKSSTLEVADIKSTDNKSKATLKPPATVQSQAAKRRQRRRDRARKLGLSKPKSLAIVMPLKQRFVPTPLGKVKSPAVVQDKQSPPPPPSKLSPREQRSIAHQSPKVTAKSPTQCAVNPKVVTAPDTSPKQALTKCAQNVNEPSLQLAACSEHTQADQSISQYALTHSAEVNGIKVLTPVNADLKETPTMRSMENLSTAMHWLHLSDASGNNLPTASFLKDLQNEVLQFIRPEVKEGVHFCIIIIIYYIFLFVYAVNILRYTSFYF